MSDHGSGPRSIANPEIDITDVYAFPSPERPGHLVLVMNMFPFKGPCHAAALLGRARLSDPLRPLQVASTGPSAAFAVGEEERAFSFTFGVPQALVGATAWCSRAPVTDRPASISSAWATRQERVAKGCASSPGAGWIRSSSTKGFPGGSGSIGGFRSKSPA